MSTEERAVYLEKERERGRIRDTDPTKKIGRMNTKSRNRARRVSAGICLLCAELATCENHCFSHWLWNIGRTYGLTLKNGGVEILRELWAEQNGICALTGEALIPGYNASIDHIVPRFRNGSNEKSNLQWVTLEVNNFKRTRNNEEIIRMSTKIAQHAERTGRSNVVPFVRKLSKENSR